MLKLLAWLFVFLAGSVQAGVGEDARCIAPAKPGGGFDLTCQLVRAALQETGQTRAPLPVVYQPGGIGAMAFRNAVTQGATDAQAVIAFSSGSLLNIAQGRFGNHGSREVRWIATLGLDHGVIAVRQDSPYRTLADLLAALRRAPNGVVFGAGGSIGSQDWMKAALLARAAGVGHKQMRFVAFEGGGEALAALVGDHVQVLPGDAAEVGRQIDQGAKVRVLAVLAQDRLPGRWAQVPTAREQGFDIRWPIHRGVYMGARAGDNAYSAWRDLLARAAAHPAYAKELARVGLQPAWLAGPELDALVDRQIAEYRRLAIEFGIQR